MFVAVPLVGSALARQGDGQNQAPYDPHPLQAEAPHGSNSVAPIVYGGYIYVVENRRLWRVPVNSFRQASVESVNLY
jgi:hypothetical protein